MTSSTTLRPRRAKKLAAYRQLLKSDRCKPIINAYVLAGGTASALRAALLPLIDLEYRNAGLPTPRELKALRAVVACHAAFHSRRHNGPSALKKWIGDPEQVKKLAHLLSPLADEARAELDEWRPTVERLQEMRRTLTRATRPVRALLARKDIIDWSRIDERLGLKPSKRIRGPLVKTLVAAALVEEFRQRFGAPCYRKALILLHDADPSFPDPHPRINPYAADWLYRRLHDIPREVVLETHARYFPT